MVTPEMVQAIGTTGALLIGAVTTSIISFKTYKQGKKISTAVGADEGQPTVLQKASEIQEQTNGNLTELRTEVRDQAKAHTDNLTALVNKLLPVATQKGKGDRAGDEGHD